MLGEEGGKDATGQHEHGDDVFLKKIESHLLTQVMRSISTAYLSSCLPACRVHVWLSLTSHFVLQQQMGNDKVHCDGTCVSQFLKALIL